MQSTATPLPLHRPPAPLPAPVLSTQDAAAATLADGRRRAAVAPAARAQPPSPLDQLLLTGQNQMGNAAVAARAAARGPTGTPPAPGC